MTTLRATVSELGARVSSLRTLQSIEREFYESTWEEQARIQREQHATSLLENDKLRNVLYEHLILADELQQLITKRPRLAVNASDDDMDDWNLYKLSATDASQGYHALVDDEYNRLEAVLVKNGLDAPVVSGPVVRCCCDPVSEVKAIEMVRSYAVPVAWTTLADAVWSIWSGGYTHEHAIYQCGELLDADAAYVAFTANLSEEASVAIPVQGNLVVKRYHDASRVVFVWRSVAKDAADTTGHIPDNECGWLIVEHAGADTTHVKLVLRAKLSTTADATLDNVDADMAGAAPIQCHLKSTSAREVTLMRLWSRYFERTWDAMVQLAADRAATVST
ncbi:hypothetical protein ACHHYP_01314 [Achlya hypogyna]|uniref:START domain-containing protein n=1 Tax=Achlya hypogyna TaxID=1202772 RepID=A0A1V9Z8U1_ACHHY|nr:hypothetical protein ACHHYP_01314 [Achlya hypogyna]